MRYQLRQLSLVAVSISCVVLTWNPVFAQPNVRYARQGYSMRLSFDNRGVLGRAAIPDSVGLEYPIGSSFEHIYGAGVWVGGILDTSTGPMPSFIRGVSTAYEGWSGPLYEFFPGSSPADSIWKVEGRGVLRPPSWDSYWGNSIPRYSFSDNDHYCLYDDHHVPIALHVPLRLKIVQSSFVWSGSYAEAIHIMEYKIINVGAKQIDSAYTGVFLDGDVGPYPVPNYYQRNFTGYYPASRTAYIHNPVDSGSTPVGVTVLHASVPLDSLRFAFGWWPGPNGPGTDASKYALLSSGEIQVDEFPSLSDTRFLLSFGPFTLRPPGSPLHDTLVVAVAIVSAQNLSALSLRAERARAIYLNGGQVSVGPPVNGTPVLFELLQNYPNPFNPTTMIRFSLRARTHTTLRIQDLLGREVARIIDGEMAPGTYDVPWDATEFGSGVYFYSLTSGERLTTRKMVLVK